MLRAPPCLLALHRVLLSQRRTGSRMMSSAEEAFPPYVLNAPATEVSTLGNGVRVASEVRALHSFPALFPTVFWPFMHAWAVVWLCFVSLESGMRALRLCGNTCRLRAILGLRGRPQMAARRLVIAADGRISAAYRCH